jgi:hypothetical protein
VTPLAERRGERAELARAVVQQMQQGRALIRVHIPGGVRWSLTSGEPVPCRIAALVVTDPNIVGVGDCLFNGAPSQTYRFVNNK